MPIRADDSRAVSECDVAARALLTVLEPNGGRYLPFARLVAEASKVGPPRDAVLDGKSVVAVDLALDRPGRIANNNVIAWKWKVTVYFDPAANWMIVGTDHVTDLTPQRRVTRTARVRETKEVKPGLFFPVKIERLSRENDGRDRTISTTTISDVRMNDKLPDSTFTLRYADGLPMRDEIRGVTYKVNSRGEC
ncbi:MAG TPA: hypothetical protein VH120_13160, partial [Gemmataceae bacterium]|nr:hypothetical protein [Gemmataceae bacterium]